MTADLDATDVERFKALVAQRFGLAFDDGKLPFLRDVLSRRNNARSLLRRFQLSTETRAEQRAIVADLTVAETYFFRSADQLRAFSDLALLARPESSSRHRLRVLSAGCASGEEPYSLAILARTLLPEACAQDVSILGVDLNATMLEKAARGHYSPWSLRETSDHVRARWFRAEGSDFVLDERIRTMVSFEERNLSVDDGAFWHAEAFDVVFCRNVTMYFTPEVARAVIARIAKSLAPGGLFFLGHAESLRGLSDDFELRQTHGTFYYARRGAPDLPAPAVSGVANTTGAPLDVVADEDTSWIDAIRDASDRVRALTDAPAPATREGDVASTHAADAALAVDLIRRERYAEARALLGRLAPDAAHDPQALLLRAVLFLHGGELAQAEQVCATILARDEKSEGAHYIVALCREDAGDRRRAIEHDRIAAHLDPEFAMPRLHLGLLARRAGDYEGARRDLEQASTLLEREGETRLALFGGGFTRAALVALCRAEIASCGGLP